MATGNAQDSGEGDEGGEGGFLSRWSRRKVQVRQGVAVAVAEPPVAPAVVVPRAVAPVVGQAVPASGLAAAASLVPVPGLPAARLQPGAPTAATADHAEPAPAAAVPPPPTLADVAALTTESDYARFVAPGVDSGVKNAALKKLFTDPHFNIMDGLDTYIADYGLPDPLPAGMLRQMAQSHALGLFADDPPTLPPTVSRPAQAGAPAALPDLPADLPDPPALASGPAALMPIDSRPESPESPEFPETPPPPKPTPDEDAALRLQPHDAAGPAGPGPGAGPHAGRPH